MNCRLCGKNLFDIGGYLERVNKHVPEEKPVYECRPKCGVQQSQETNLLQAIKGDEDVHKL